MIEVPLCQVLEGLAAACASASSYLRTTYTTIHTSYICVYVYVYSYMRRIHVHMYLHVHIYAYVSYLYDIYVVYMHSSSYICTIFGTRCCRASRSRAAATASD